MVVFPLSFPYNKLKENQRERGTMACGKEEQLDPKLLYGEETADRSRYALYENGTYMVISKFAYLIGVPFHIFENEHEPPKMGGMKRLKKIRRMPGSFGTSVCCGQHLSATTGTSIRLCGMI